MDIACPLWTLLACRIHEVPTVATKAKGPRVGNGMPMAFIRAKTRYFGSESPGGQPERRQTGCLSKYTGKPC